MTTNENKEPEILINFIQPFFTFVLGYYLFILFGELQIDLKIVFVIILQFLFFTTISNLLLIAFKWLINKWIKKSENWDN